MDRDRLVDCVGVLLYSLVESRLHVFYRFSEGQGSVENTA